MLIAEAQALALPSSPALCIFARYRKSRELIWTLIMDILDSSEHRPTPDTLEIVSHLIYLARHTQAGSEHQRRCLDLAADVISQARHHAAISSKEMAALVL